MADEVVLDASVAAKCFFTEEGSDAARRLAGSGIVLVAPDLIFAEISSVAAKRVRRGEVSRDLAQDAVNSLGDLIDIVTPTRLLSVRAFQLAADHGLSAYDGVYLALAELRRTTVVTADVKLIDRASQHGLSHLVARVEDQC